MKIFDMNITVVGLGLIGGSFAKALKNININNVWAIDIDEDALRNGEKQGIINKGYLESKEPLSKSDVVIMALYPNMTVEFIKNNMDNFKKGAIITDTSGIKSYMVKRINKFIRSDVEFIGGHPMAGREFKGLDNSSSSIFKNANYLITPTSMNCLEKIKVIEDIVSAIGCSQITKITPERHDEIIAYTSQLPHLMAAALVNSDNCMCDTSAFVAGSFKDATRVADINSELWTELICLNKENVIEKIEVLENELRIFKEAIANNNERIIKEKFDNAAIKRRELVKCKV